MTCSGMKYVTYKFFESSDILLSCVSTGLLTVNSYFIVFITVFSKAVQFFFPLVCLCGRLWHPKINQ